MLEIIHKKLIVIMLLISIVLFCFRRLDYFVLSKKLMKNVCDSIMRNEVLGSDHCPIVLYVHV